MFEGITDYIKQNPEQVIILFLFLLSEILGSMSRFKSSSVFQLLITILRGMLSKTSFGALVPSVTIEPPVDSTTLIKVDSVAKPTVVDPDTLIKIETTVDKPLIDTKDKDKVS